MCSSEPVLKGLTFRCKNTIGYVTVKVTYRLALLLFSQLGKENVSGQQQKTSIRNVNSMKVAEMTEVSSIRWTTESIV